MRPSLANLLIVALLVMAAGPEPLTFTAQTVGGPGSNQPGELFPPAGATSPGQGRFPAIVVLHGCDGIGPHYRTWARRLSAWGYAAILVDSFRPRGVTSVCNHGMIVPPEEQAADGFAAAAYLRTLPSVLPDQIGVVGFSHGGWAVLKAVLADPPVRPFAAAVAFYPGCDPPIRPLVTDTLILIGDADDWTPVSRCRLWRDRANTNGHSLTLKIYPDARHGFDSERPVHWFAGHFTGRNDAAATDALVETQAFLNTRLR